MFIPIILGTAREGRQSEKAANFVFKEIKRNGLDTELIDVRDYTHKATDNTKKSAEAQKLSEKIIKADGLIIVLPEYNHGYPGELKIFLDMLYEEYFGKPVGFCGVSIGILGGARAVEQLRLVSVEFHMVPIREAIYFSNVANLFNDDGTIKDSSYAERIKKFLDELVGYAEAFKNRRNS